MSGHSKWASIRHKKGAADAKRGKIFSKYAKLIMVAAKEGGGDLGTNFSLRLLVEKAKGVNMPKDNIERAIKRGTGEIAGGELTSALYEAMGPGGAALLIESLTDNTNRAYTNIRTIVSKSGANFDAKVLWQFDHRGVVRVDDVTMIEDRDELELALIEVGAEDIAWDEGLVIISQKGDLQAVENAVTEAGLMPESSELEYVPQNEVKLSESDEDKLASLIEKLDDDDDVNNVFTNAA
jgi:YebC/PmpR family DNA-binding regulatory protein